MVLGNVTRAGLLASVEECQYLGHDAFRHRYGSGQATTLSLVVDDNRYDAVATACAAHLYSVGNRLSADDLTDGAHAVARRLRELGFTVEDGSADASGLQRTAPQLLLQPRGGARDHGPQNFARSVRQGVEIAHIQDALGEQADVLADLYPDGIARLWGSVPTRQVNNEKVRALRGRRVGDDVYFYAGHHFFARARILHLFNSPPVAHAVWGTDANQATWENIMALGEVEEFSAPVLAAPILRSLNVPAPLRSLTLRSAEDYRRVVDLFPDRQQPPRPAAPTRPSAASPRLTSSGLLNRLGSLNAHRHPGHRAPSRHQPITLLWAISRVASGKARLAPWACFRTEVGPLLAEFGLTGSKVTPEYPFWHLRRSGLWEVHGIPGEAGRMPQIGIFNTHQPVAGLSCEAAELLRDPMTRLEAVATLCSTYLDTVDQRTLLNRIGLAGYATANGLTEDSAVDEVADEEPAAGPTARRTPGSARLVRNAALARQVKELHGHTCQVCETRLRYKRRPYNEAAHIRGLGFPHNGPDELSNLLCLCPNHHVLFDGLEIYVAPDGVVRRTQGGEPLGRLRRHPGHRIAETYLRYHRTLCDLNKRAG
ncbi:HNH endonuclease [Streptomyces sp. NPDC059788]|uniref:HNH endonuclease n=1 Tax=Streptomyces sp. NPDC059788 TaxID=3346948 RepID=UPI0036469ECE